MWLSADDQEAYVHAWNVIGHGMGIRDDLLPSARASRAVFVPARLLNRLATRMERDSVLTRKLSETLGRRFFRGFLAYERHGGHRPDFELSDAVAEQLRLR